MRFRRWHRPEPYRDTSRKRAAFARKQRLEREALVAMHPYYIARTVGGLCFLLGAIVGAYNIAMIIRMARLGGLADASDVPVKRPAGVAVQPGE